MDKHNYLYIHNVYFYESSRILFKLKNNLSYELVKLYLILDFKDIVSLTKFSTNLMKK